jgi:ribonuclease P protein component
MDHRLKGEKLIARTFADGRSAFVYPIKIVYMWQPETDPKTGYRIGVSVSKRNLKRAVDRNLIKRRLREAFRMHIGSATLLASDQLLVCMLIYVSKDIMEYKTIDQSVKRALRKIKTG